MSYRVTLTRVSYNTKTGPIPVSITSDNTCPSTCGEFDTCYAKFGHLSLHWKAINNGTRGTNWSEFCDAVQGLPKRQLWRHNQAGDLPGDGRRIDADALDQLVKSNTGKKGFTYTHYPLTGTHNLDQIENAIRKGFTINISCSTLAESDKVTDITDAPQAVVLPSTTNVKSLRTPAGRKVLVCPATYRDDINCSNCQICQNASPRRAVIGFPAHGVKKKVIDLKLIRGAA